MITQIQSRPTPFMWEGPLGILDERGRVILDERGRGIREDRASVVLPGISQDLNAYWRFDQDGNTYIDVTGRGNDWTDGLGTPVPSNNAPFVPGIINEGVALPVGTVIFSMNRVNLIFPTSAGFTIAGHFRRNTTDIGARLLFTLEQGTNTYQLVNNYSAPDQFFRFYDLGNTSNLDFFTLNAGSGTTQDRWIFYCAWIDPADNKCRLRLDDTTFVTSGTAVPTAGATATLSIQSEFWLDEMGMWPRVLTSAEQDTAKVGTYPFE